VTVTTPLLCPLCGAANECGIALGKDTCWCFSTTVPADVLARVPEEQRNQICVCQRCAKSAAASVAGPTLPEG
jgi:hypothetical protein